MPSTITNIFNGPDGLTAPAEGGGAPSPELKNWRASSISLRLCGFALNRNQHPTHPKLDTAESIGMVTTTTLLPPFAPVQTLCTSGDASCSSCASVSIQSRNSPGRKSNQFKVYQA
jgi:hypothetical protein